MVVCNTHPKFEADQILTAHQLNELFHYLDSQLRLTRRCFIGAGAMCGLKVSLNSSTPSVHITSGCGLTTLGYAVKMNATVYTHVKKYTDPVGYSHFKKAEEQLPLWEMLETDSFDTADPDIKKMTTDFLKNKVVLLYLEIQEKDLDSCTGDDCDEQGIQVGLCVKALLVEKSNAKDVMEKHARGSYSFFLESQMQRYNLPSLQVGRISWLGNEEFPFKLEDINGMYTQILNTRFTQQLKKAFSLSYNIYKPILSEIFNDNPFEKWNFKLPDNLGIQYYYDHIKDLLLAYEEFVEYSFDLIHACCAPEMAFPKHLMLGEIDAEENCKPSLCRHHFMPASLFNGGELKIDKAQSLFTRLVLLIQAFDLPAFKSSTIKLTPSYEKGTPLGLRAIPYYYNPKDFKEFQKNWNYDEYRHCDTQLLSYHHNKCEPVCKESIRKGVKKFKAYDPREIKGAKIFDKIGSSAMLINDEGMYKYLVGEYLTSNMLEKSHVAIHSNPVERPMNFSLDKFNYVKFEAYLGKDLNEAFKEIKEWLECFNIPIKLMALKIGDKYDDIDISMDCKFEDLELIYITQRAKMVCLFEKTIKVLSGMKFDEPEHNYKDEGITKVTGILKDDKSGDFLSEMVYEIKGAKKRGRTDKTGSLELTGMDPGEYEMVIYGNGYDTKEFTVNINENKELELGDIGLRTEKYTGESYGYTGNPYSAPKTSAGTMIGTAYSGNVKSMGDTLIPYAGTKKMSGMIGESSYGISEDGSRYGAVEGGVIGEYGYGTSSGGMIGESSSGSIGGGFIGEHSVGISSDSSKKYEAEIVYKDEESDYSLGKMVKTAMAKGKGRDIYEMAENYLYEKFPTSKVKDPEKIIDKIFYPFQIIQMLEALVEDMNVTLLQFNVDHFRKVYRELSAKITTYKNIIMSEDASDWFSGDTILDIVTQLQNLQQEGCFDHFEVLLESYAARKTAVQKMHLFSNYAGSKWGMTHGGGAPFGGTFFLIYDNSFRVVLDYSLPYICCSDCPPIQMCTGLPIVFKLPKERFCMNDILEYSFILNPPGGEVKGPGVRKVPTTGEFTFLPSAEDVVTGNVNFEYHFNEGVYQFSAFAIEAKVKILYQILEVDSDAKTAKVEFAPNPSEAREFLWDFGDESHSSQKSPVHVYDVSTTQEFEVKLKAIQTECTAKDDLKLTFEICNAKFGYKEVARDFETITYEFNHPQLAKEHKWDFGDGVGTSEDSNPTYVFKRGETAEDRVVKLLITQDTCSDTHSETISIPALKKLSLIIGDTEFCIKSTAISELTGDPAGGTYKGNGIVFKDGKYGFLPSHPDVSVGEQELVYELGGQTASVKVRVDDAKAGIKYGILDVDGDTNKAKVQFTGPNGMDIYKYSFGDSNTSNEQSPTNIYDISSVQKFEVIQRVTKGVCTDEIKIPLEITPCTGDFLVNVIEGNGLYVTVTFTAVDKDATKFQWDDGSIAVTTTGNTYKKNYKLGAIARDFEMTLKVVHGVCHASGKQTVNLPAATILSVELDTYYGICDKGLKEVIVNPPGGTLSGPGIRDNKYFIPALAGLNDGVVEIVYELEGQVASTLVNIMTPKAIFDIAPVKKVSEGKYTISVESQSLDANTFAWDFNNGTKAVGEKVSVTLSNLVPGSAVGVTLFASWDKICVSSVTRKVLIPSEIVQPGITEPGLVVDIGRGDVVDISGPSLEITSDVTVKDRIGAVTTLGENASFKKLFPANDPNYIGTLKAYEKLQSDLGDPALIKEYADGKNNLALAKSLGGLMQTTFEKILESPDITQQNLGFVMLLTQFTQILDVVSLQGKDLTRTDPLFLSMSSFVKNLGTAIELGIKVNPNSALSKSAEAAMQANSSKPNVSALIIRIGEMVA